MTMKQHGTHHASDTELIISVQPITEAFAKLPQRLNNKEVYNHSSLRQDVSTIVILNVIGTSSWIDFTNPEYRHWWADQFSLDNYKVRFCLQHKLYLRLESDMKVENFFSKNSSKLVDNQKVRFLIVVDKSVLDNSMILFDAHDDFLTWSYLKLSRGT